MNILYVYPGDNLEEERTIETVIDEFVDSYKTGNFDTLIDEMIFLKEEAMLINTPYLGKIYLPGLQFITADPSLLVKKRIKENFSKRRTRKRLNWSALKLREITEKEISEGGYSIGKNVFTAVCEFTVMDDNRNMKFRLQFMKLRKKWYLFYPK